MALTNSMTSHPNRRTIRRHVRNTGWWDLVWSTYAIIQRNFQSNEGDIYVHTPKHSSGP